MPPTPGGDAVFGVACTRALATIYLAEDMLFVTQLRPVEQVADGTQVQHKVADSHPNPRRHLETSDLEDRARRTTTMQGQGRLASPVHKHNNNKVLTSAVVENTPYGRFSIGKSQSSE